MLLVAVVAFCACFCTRAPAEDSHAAASPPQAPPAKACPSDPEPGNHTLPIVAVTFPGLPGVGLDAELARTPHDSERGLMYRTSMPESHGMFFDLGQRADHRFWMHNTCISLDLLYIDENGRIVGIVESAPILDDHELSVGRPSVSVLEVNAGWSRRHGVRIGQTVALALPPR